MASIKNRQSLVNDVAKFPSLLIRVTFGLLLI
ncbi:unnamed protein product [Schistosoma margrebowiei]|uniref:Uncharacterized protein n=1 Tax=Schistosoma margrebowiei TaxID=48269 RepID=A0A183LH74_9TREM|nr:unnamed protein product [Schistosoma margrebowiei]